MAAIVSLNRWGNWRKAALAHINGQVVLEIGYGTGHLQVELMKLGFRPFGLDESWQMAGITSKNLLKNNSQPAVVCGKSQALPYASESVEVIISTFPSEYITDKRTLGELIRVLKPSGRLVIIPMAWMGGKTIQAHLAKWLFKITGQTADLNENLESRIKSVFAEAGFEVKTIVQNVGSDLVLIVLAEKPAWVKK